MATYSANQSKHATLTAGTVDTVTFPVDLDRVEIANRGTAEIYFTLEGQTPTVGGDDCYVVTAGGSLQVEPRTNQGTVVKLISSAATAYSVTAASN